LCLFHQECQAWELETGGFCRLLQTTAGPGLTLSANDYTLVGILKSDARGRPGFSGLHEVRKTVKGPGAPAAPEARAAGASQGLSGMGADAVNTSATPAAAVGGAQLGSAAVISPEDSFKCYSPGGALIKCIEDDEPCGDDGSGRGPFSNSSESLSSAFSREQSVDRSAVICCRC
jgi:hypothetical protein